MKLNTTVNVLNEPMARLPNFFYHPPEFVYFDKKMFLWQDDVRCVVLEKLDTH